VPVAHANDGGGSIRIPAACNGLVGLKPTRARTSLGPVIGDAMAGLVNELVVSRSVRDTAAMLDCVAGAMPGDPYVAPPGPKSWLAASRKKPGKLRIAVARTKLGGGALHPDCVAAVDHAAQLCRDLGHKVEEASPPVTTEEMIEPFMALWTGGLAMLVDAVCQATGQKPGVKKLEGLTLGLYEAGKKISASELFLAIAAIQQTARTVAAWHERYDVWLTPTLGAPPLELGAFDLNERDPVKGFAPMIDFVPFTAMQNGTGQPAINVPLYWNDANLPIGTQFVGRFGEEALLLQLATQLEAAAPWKKRYRQIA
jgi:amidase